MNKLTKTLILLIFIGCFGCLPSEKSKQDPSVSESQLKTISSSVESKKIVDSKEVIRSSEIHLKLFISETDQRHVIAECHTLEAIQQFQLELNAASTNSIEPVSCDRLTPILAKEEFEKEVEVFVSNLDLEKTRHEWQEFKKSQSRTATNTAEGAAVGVVICVLLPGCREALVAKGIAVAIGTGLAVVAASIVVTVPAGEINYQITREHDPIYNSGEGVLADLKKDESVVIDPVQYLAVRDHLSKVFSVSQPVSQ